MDSKKELVSEIRLLEERRASLKKVINQREAEQRKLPSQVSNAVREAFEKAKTQGAEALGTVAVFEHLLRGATSLSETSSHGGTADFEVPRLTWRRLDPLLGRVEETLVNHGTPQDCVGAIAQTIDVTTKAGLVLMLSGVAASSVAECVARNLSKKSVLVTNVGIGVLGVESISSQLRELGDTADCLVLKAANHSDVECYAAELLDYVLTRIVSGENEPPKIIFTLSDGPSGLPLSSRAERISVHINLDAESTINVNDDVSDLMELVEEEEKREGKRGKRVWRPALKRLLAAHRELPSEVRSAVASQLKKGFVDRALRRNGNDGEKE